MNGFEKTGHRVLTHSGFVFKPVYIKRPRIAAMKPTGDYQTTKLLYLQL
jgi:hypothetical protein